MRKFFQVVLFLCVVVEQSTPPFRVPQSWIPLLRASTAFRALNWSVIPALYYAPPQTMTARTTHDRALRMGIQLSAFRFSEPIIGLAVLKQFILGEQHYTDDKYEAGCMDAGWAWSDFWLIFFLTMNWKPV